MWLWIRKQLSLFNLISAPENPVKIKKCLNKVSILYKYSKDSEAQIRQAKKFLDDIKLGKKKTHLDVKLLELLA